MGWLHNILLMMPRADSNVPVCGSTRAPLSMNLAKKSLFSSSVRSVPTTSESEPSLSHIVVTKTMFGEAGVPHMASRISKDRRDAPDMRVSVIRCTYTTPRRCSCFLCRMCKPIAISFMVSKSDRSVSSNPGVSKMSVQCSSYVARCPFVSVVPKYHLRSAW